MMKARRMLLSHCSHAAAAVLRAGHRRFPTPSYSIHINRAFSSVKHDADIPSINFAGVQSEGRVLRVAFADGGATKFHAEWLRDHCRCSRCWFKPTSQRLPHRPALTVVPGIKMDSAALVRDPSTSQTVVHITWRDGPDLDATTGTHTSTFSAEFLRVHAYWRASHGGKGQTTALTLPSTAQDPVTDKRTRVLWKASNFGRRNAPDSERFFPVRASHEVSCTL